MRTIAVYLHSKVNFASSTAYAAGLANAYLHGERRSRDRARRRSPSPEASSASNSRPRGEFPADTRDLPPPQQHGKNKRRNNGNKSGGKYPPQNSFGGKYHDHKEKDRGDYDAGRRDRDRNRSPPHSSESGRSDKRPKFNEKADSTQPTPPGRSEPGDVPVPVPPPTAPVAANTAAARGSAPGYVVYHTGVPGAIDAVTTAAASAGIPTDPFGSETGAGYLGDNLEPYGYISQHPAYQDDLGRPGSGDGHSHAREDAPRDPRRRQ